MNNKYKPFKDIEECFDWRSPKEEPNRGNQDIVIDCGNNKIEFYRYRSGTPVEWSTFVSKKNIIQWAYSMDLILEDGLL